MKPSEHFWKGFQTGLPVGAFAGGIGLMGFGIVALNPVFISIGAIYIIVSGLILRFK